MPSSLEKVPGRLAGSNVTVICVFSPGRTGLRENCGTVQPHEVTTSRITTGRSERFSPVKVWLTRPCSSRIVPKSHASGVKTSASCAGAASARSVQKISMMNFFIKLSGREMIHAKLHFL